MENNNSWTQNLGKDVPASIVVFLVALPLCLGIALASEAPLFSGIIAGIIGGIVIGFASGSSLAVSGPAAGLAVIVADGIGELGSFNIFLLAVMIGGLMQLTLGLLKAGVVANFFPDSVIKGMLSAIGLILIFKQIPHAFGLDEDYEGDMSFWQKDGENTLTEILKITDYLTPGAIIITVISLAILILWGLPQFKKFKFFQVVPGAMIVVLFGIFANVFYKSYMPEFYLQDSHLVSNIPLSFGEDGGFSFSKFTSNFTLPDFSAIGNYNMWVIAFTIAMIASIETLLSIEATDKLDPLKRITPTNRELIAQGMGNTLSGLIGGLPITAVIVRSSANISSGARTKVSAVLHGFMLLATVAFIPQILNLIPKSALAAVLLLVGYKLTKPVLYKQMYRKGWDQFLPFIITIIAIYFTDLLIGIAIGMVVGFFFVMKSNYHSAITVARHNNNYLLRLKKDVSFLNKIELRTILREIPAGSHVLIDGTRAKFVDSDIQETLKEFTETASMKDITVELKSTMDNLNGLAPRTKEDLQELTKA
ncbi:SulP family inorganic anion transporter [Roseivirga sp. BDSF3-8]|uniref:SulP family inorganic anion transporter n=1 Tax=Roseivirga sp. BDSF3-8 TaxID=3241598 RepID=UPI003531F4AF